MIDRMRVAAVGVRTLIWLGGIAWFTLAAWCTITGFDGSALQAPWETWLLRMAPCAVPWFGFCLFTLLSVELMDAGYVVAAFLITIVSLAPFVAMSLGFTGQVIALIDVISTWMLEQLGYVV